MPVFVTISDIDIDRLFSDLPLTDDAAAVSTTTGDATGDATGDSAVTEGSSNTAIATSSSSADPSATSTNLSQAEGNNPATSSASEKEGDAATDVIDPAVVDSDGNPAKPNPSTTTKVQSTYVEAVDVKTSTVLHAFADVADAAAKLNIPQYLILRSCYFDAVACYGMKFRYTRGIFVDGKYSPFKYFLSFFPFFFIF